jgi:transposase InsO family protein
MRLEAGLYQGLRPRMASLLGVSERTLRNWTRGAQGEKKPLGRPARSESKKFRAGLAVRRQLRVLGWTAGWRPLDAVLETPTRLIQESLRALKARHRKRVREHREANRMSVKVLAKDVIWTQDATHAGRIGGKAVLAEVVRDRGTLGNVAMAVGEAATGRDVVEMLEIQKREGRLPLVWATDNGPAYKSEEVAEFCKREKLVHLFSRIHTPQDNAAAERGIGELKAEAGLGKNACFRAVREVASCLAKTWFLLDARPRACRDNRSAVQLEKDLPAGPDLVDRGVFYKATCAEVEKAVQGGGTPRERRQAERLAIYETLGKIYLVNIMRGGKTCRA